jgi:two-component system phosphate regulon sensor histidine kinase PhoR
MARKNLIWQIYPSYIVIILITLILVTLYTTHSIKKFYLNKVEENNKILMSLYQDRFSDLIQAKNNSELNKLCKWIYQKSLVRITIIFTDGKVIGDSIENPDKMDNHSNRPEFLEAIRGKTSNTLRFSHTLHKNMLYNAIPLYNSDKITGVLRTSISAVWLDKNLKDMHFKIFLGGIISALIAALIGLSFTKRIQNPIEMLEEGAMRFAGGNLNKKIPIPSINEFGELAESMNIMAAQLDDRIKTITRQSNEQEIIFSNMSEGILAIDSNFRIIKINSAAIELLEIKNKNFRSANVNNVVSNQSFLGFVNDIFLEKKSLQREIVTDNNGYKYIQANGTLIGDKDTDIEVIIVLNDVTKIHRLENIRKDFVANVSHELKTPITAIKGFIETIIDSGFECSEDNKNYIGIISRHTDRLNAIIEDLLSLSRMEQTDGKLKILEKISLNQVINSAVQICETAASAKAIKIKLIIDEQIEAKVDALLLEQSLVNLIDNAIKYSNEGTEVTIKSLIEGNEIIIEVKDQGFGIPEEHINRIFERFYRVDKARSRKLGGTGLGLAIVKHIVQTLNGYITVSSRLNQGSSFFIHLPV